MVRLLLIAWLWLLPFGAQAAAIMAQLDRNPVAVGDPVVLTFTADRIVAGDPDFSPLEQDFEIRGRSQSNSFSMVNGVSSITTTWELRLYPRRTGTVPVPPIAFGADQSQALDLQVMDQPPPQANTGNSSDILIELTAEPQQPYVQQQTVITQRMLHITPLQPQASLSHPEVEAGKGNIQQLGKTRNTTLMRNGRNYQVIERRYALTPQQSGTLTLGRTTFDGIIDDKNNYEFDPFGMSGKRIRRFSEPLTLQVQGQPASYTGKQWLPANSLTLNAHWQTPADKLKAGEPVTLTLAIVADGLAAEQLPKLDIQAPAGIKAYTDQPELRNDPGSNGVVGVRQEKWVVVAPYNGEYTFPGLSIDWWNTTTGKQETTTLDPVKLVVTGGQAAPAAANTTTATELKQADPATPPPATTPDTPEAAGWFAWFSWDWYATALLIIWGALSVGWLLWHFWKKAQITPKQSAKTAYAPASVRPPDAKTVWQRLEQACKQNQPQAAHDALLQWMEVGLHLRPALLANLREQAPPALQAEIDALNAVLYGRSSGGWRGASLWQALQGFKLSNGQTAVKTSELASLYPD
ncbi:protein BatD [Thiothrix subterranea]|uniref:BatD family protein n=1 Tax=Thiothrix subterranea TaxID=2735563 RepID=UPI00192C2D80|nr:BatD family protein [Thiothrix subterranea]QQZ30608.1 protein BatD [Thiothrix subterranea]